MTARQVLVLSGIILLIAVLLSSGCMTGVPGERARVEMTPEELVAFVQDAAYYARETGQATALEEFSKKSGLYSKGDLYIYAYDFDGTLLAHPYEAEQVGGDRSDWTDIRGLPVIRIAEYAASNGGGYSAYLYPRPEGGVIDEDAPDTYIPKIGYSCPAGTDWWIGSGIYITDLAGDEPGEYPPVVDTMISLVESGVEYGRLQGEDEAFREISNRTGMFVDAEGHYLYAYDYNGTLLAHPYLTESIGESLIEREDPFGMKNIRALSETAGSGGGFVVFIWPNPDRDNRLEQKIGYVLPVDGRWWVGSGVYLSEITGVDTSLPALPP
ncbi:MAG TPA: cache domain-containing protein [Methanoregulaceae archaeon]|nr:cache domain-containing protein [Methanoregulaceae archaeon]HOP66220.1 cache domain-containing protein [Methanoregulaceae archaeon]HPQ75181.1 cache domain-containing protein [Methanoregulaceae archaeon]HRX32867.1 cache domain-containing protein [Methanoregulaceae archaeon]